MLGRQVRFIDTDGRAIDPQLVQAGARVELGFDRMGRVNHYGTVITTGITGIEFITATTIIIITTIKLI